MDILELLKAILFGIVEGITEWLPISSTGHMILLDEFLHLNTSAAFKEMFLVVVQLGAIFAVVVLFWNTLMPIGIKGGLHFKKDTFSMWLKILVASVPAAIIGIFFDDFLTPIFYNYQTVAIMLILFGVFFIVVEKFNKGKSPKIQTIDFISFRMAFIIGIFQMIAAVFPGTSRSGATIVGALLLGISRATAAEFTFFLAIPAMFGGSALKLLKFGFSYTSAEITILLVGMAVAFIVSIITIKFLMGYIKKHSFTAFGIYRIALGFAVLAYFLLAK